MELSNGSSPTSSNISVAVIPVALDESGQKRDHTEKKITQSEESLSSDISKSTTKTTSSSADLISDPPWYSSPKSCLSNVSVIVYCSQGLSQWGDRMWSFAVGLFLIEISPESLRLTATYGLTSGILLFLLGAIIGDWVDKTERLKTARISLFVQNISVLLCACLVGVYLTWNTELTNYLEGAGDVITKVFIIGLAIIAKLASLAGSISVRNDWVVVICDRDSDKLTSMTAVLRRIDLATKLLSPVIVGQIMTYISVVAGSIFIAVWNLLSVFVEYFLLHKVYYAVPNLSKKKKDSKPTSDPVDEAVGDLEATELQTDCLPGQETDIQESDTKVKADVAREAPTKNSENNNKICCKCCEHPFFKLSFSMVFKLINGWKTYISYDVAGAGLGLALLYMTVLGFDNITTGFAYSQGVNESILGILMAVGAITGILATFLYPRLKRKLGLPTTGLISFSLLILCLVSCLASIATPGNPYGLVTFSGNPAVNQSIEGNTTAEYSENNATNLTTESSTDGIKIPSSYISVSLLMAGIITARFGLWMSDLTVSQLLLENVDETERGVVNGVQNSLNMLMDLLKFLLVLLVPKTPDFWILIIISFLFICFGGMSFAKYALFKSGDFEKFKKYSERKKDENKKREHNAESESDAQIT